MKTYDIFVPKFIVCDPDFEFRVSVGTFILFHYINYLWNIIYCIKRKNILMKL